MLVKFLLGLMVLFAPRHATLGLEERDDHRPLDSSLLRGGRSLSETCDDGDACTVDTWDSAKGECVYTPIICEDNNIWTLDVCVPRNSSFGAVGCHHLDFSNLDLDNLAEYYDSVIEVLPSDTYYYEDEATLSEVKINAILNWINKQVILTRTPYCYKQTYGRGAGKALTDCPSSKEKIGALCYTPCQSGYSRQGTFDCQQQCKAGWRDDGLFCRLAEYGRGTGRLKSRCEANHGGGNCENCLGLWYPKCKPGYSPFGCNICRPARPDCASEGYSTPRFDLSCPVKIVMGDPTPLICASGLEEVDGLCYPPCREGFKGISFLCWQVCDGSQFNCGAGCAIDQLTCALETANMVWAPIMAAIKIKPVGLKSIPSPVQAAPSGVKRLKVASTVVECSSSTGYSAGKAASTAVNINPADIVTKLAPVIVRAKQVGKVVKVGYQIYKATMVYSYVFSRNFAVMTSEEINSTLDNKLPPKDAKYIKELWSSITFQELKEAEGWNIAQTVLSFASIVDPTGLVGLVSAYANPICKDVVPFPDLAVLNSPPKAVCNDVQIAASLASGCQGSVPPDVVGAGSTDPDGDLLTFSLSGGPFTVAASPHTVSLTVTDRDSKSDTCTSKITVIDLDEAAVSCPTATLQGTDPSTCSAVVHYPAPVVTDNCQGRSTLELISGYESGSVFPLGESLNAYEVTTSEGAKSICTFSVAVRDTEAPKISCDGLTTTLPTEPGICNVSHSFVVPVATDNCQDNFDPEQFQAGVYVQQIDGNFPADGLPYPLGTTTNTFAAYDNAANQAQCSFDIVVVDDESPSISCPDSIVIAAIEFCDRALVTYPTPNVTDNCSVKDVVLTSGQESGTQFPLGVTTVTWTVTDSSGNVNSCSFNVSVVEDLDKDGTRDCEDNCPTTYNPDQSDADLDKVGDACDALLCNNCWPRTSGPCRQSNSVCHAFRGGRCPVGTRPCQTIPLPLCSKCSPGTYGPCQQTNGVCWEKESNGKCPTGTKECAPQ